MHTLRHTHTHAADLRCDCALSSRTLREWQEAHGARRQHIEGEVSWVLNDGSGLIKGVSTLPLNLSLKKDCAEGVQASAADSPQCVHCCLFGHF